MALRVVTPPTGTIIALDDMKAHLRVETGEEDDYITALLSAADRMVEAETQRRFLTQTIEWVRDCWADPMPLPIAPATDCAKIAVASVTYADLSGATQTLDPTLYWARPAGPTLQVSRRWYVIWPWLGDAAERVVIRIQVTGTSDDAPAGIKHAIKLLVAHWYAHREGVVGVDNRDSSAPLPLGVESLLSPERWA